MWGLISGVRSSAEAMDSQQRDSSDDGVPEYPANAPVIMSCHKGSWEIDKM